MNQKDLSTCPFACAGHALTLSPGLPGEAMRDELIRSQMTSFLVAGHETTSAMLTFTIIWMLQHPETYRRAQDEVDQILGSESVTLAHIRELKYCMACIHEALRLAPTAPIISKIPHPDKKHEATILGGKYKIEPTDRCPLLLGKCMQVCHFHYDTKSCMANYMSHHLGSQDLWRRCS